MHAPSFLWGLLLFGSWVQGQVLIDDFDAGPFDQASYLGGNVQQTVDGSHVLGTVRNVTYTSILPAPVPPTTFSLVEGTGHFQFAGTAPETMTFAYPGSTSQGLGLDLNALGAFRIELSSVTAPVTAAITVAFRQGLDTIGFETDTAENLQAGLYEIPTSLSSIDPSATADSITLRLSGPASPLYSYNLESFTAVPEPPAASLVVAVAALGSAVVLRRFSRRPWAVGK